MSTVLFLSLWLAAPVQELRALLPEPTAVRDFCYKQPQTDCGEGCCQGDYPYCCATFQCASSVEACGEDSCDMPCDHGCCPGSHPVCCGDNMCGKSAEACDREDPDRVEAPPRGGLAEAHVFDPRGQPPRGCDTTGGAGWTWLAAACAWLVRRRHDRGV